MRCEEVLGAWAAGESSPALESHVAGCARCAAVVRGAAALRLATPPSVPTVGAFRARERRERAVRVGLLAAAVAVFGVWASGLGVPEGVAGGVASHDSRPPLVAGEGPWDVRTGMDDLVDPDPLGDLADPTDLFDVALSGEGSL